MNNGRDNLNACYNCGTLNVTGVKWCANCYAVQYYNCPYCQSWVDNSFSNCPACGNKLRWPSEGYHAEYAFSPNKSTSSAVVVLLLCIAVLSIVAVNFITNNSNPVDAVSHTPVATVSNNLPTSELKTATQPVIEVLSPAAETPSMTETDPSASYTGSDANPAEESISYEIINNMPVIPTSVTTTQNYVPTSSSYLQMMYPNWGHCSGGSCSGYSQCGQ